jgi:hypothetical protein
LPAHAELKYLPVSTGAAKPLPVTQAGVITLAGPILGLLAPQGRVGPLYYATEAPETGR